MRDGEDTESRLDCQQVKELLFLYYDNELDRAAMVSFYRHAERCPKCWRRVGYTTRLLTTVTLRTRRTIAPQELRERILTRLQGH